MQGKKRDCERQWSANTFAVCFPKSDDTRYGVVIFRVWMGSVLWPNVVARVFGTDVRSKTEIGWVFQHTPVGTCSRAHADCRLGFRFLDA